MHGRGAIENESTMFETAELPGEVHSRRFVHVDAEHRKHNLGASNVHNLRHLGPEKRSEQFETA